MALDPTMTEPEAAEENEIATEPKSAPKQIPKPAGRKRVRGTKKIEVKGAKTKPAPIKKG